MDRINEGVMRDIGSGTNSNLPDFAAGTTALPLETVVSFEPSSTSDPSPTSNADGSPQQQASSTGTSSTSHHSPTVVIFDDSKNFDGGGVDKETGDGGGIGGNGGDDNDAKRHVLSGAASKPFKWNPANDTVTLKDVFWLSNGSAIDNASIPSEQTGQALIFVNRTQAVLDLPRIKNFYGTQMAIRVEWETEHALGFSESSIFTVTNDADEADDFEAIWKTASKEQRTGREGISGGSNSDIGKGGATPSPKISGDSGSRGGGKGGIAAGAIAGIVIGVVIALVSVIGLVWFLRRRRSQRRGVSHGSEQPARSYVADKEDAQARVTESPTSPYSDDGLGRGQQEQLPRNNNSHLPPPGTTFTTHHRAESSSRPDLSGNAETPQDGGGNVSRAVAHLVEDGMTHDEIRRLEEEERHLDAEIERAGRRSP